MVAGGKARSRPRTASSPKGEGWYVVNAREARWYENDEFGRYVNFEGDVRFAQVGFNIARPRSPGSPPACTTARRTRRPSSSSPASACSWSRARSGRSGQWDFFHCSALDGARDRGRGRRPVRLRCGGCEDARLEGRVSADGRGAAARGRGGGGDGLRGRRVRAHLRARGSPSPRRRSARVGVDSAGVVSPSKLSGGIPWPVVDRRRSRSPSRGGERPRSASRSGS